MSAPERREGGDGRFVLVERLIDRRGEAYVDRLDNRGSTGLSVERLRAVIAELETMHRRLWLTGECLQYVPWTPSAAEPEPDDLTETLLDFARRNQHDDFVALARMTIPDVSPEGAERFWTETRRRVVPQRTV